MKEFKLSVEEYENFRQSVRGAKKVRDFCEFSQQDVETIYNALNDIYEEVKLPENRKLILQENMMDDNLLITNDIDILKLLNMRALLAGVSQNADSHDLEAFAMEGDAGYSALRFNMVKNVVAREQKGIDYGEEKESFTL